MAKPHKRKKKKQYSSVFPILYPSRLGTPYGFTPGSGNRSGGGKQGGGLMGSRGGAMGGSPMGTGGSGGASGGAGGGMGSGVGAAESIAPRPSRARVIHEMKKAMNLTEYFDDNAAMGGFSIPSFASVSMRSGGPVIGGPGFQHDGHGEGGVFNFKKSPGLGFSTEKGWKVWEKAMQIIDNNKTLSKTGILLRAMAKAGVHKGQIDPAEYRLLEMGVEWYLSDAGALGAKRTVAY